MNESHTHMPEHTSINLGAVAQNCCVRYSYDALNV